MAERAIDKVRAAVAPREQLDAEVREMARALRLGFYSGGDIEFTVSPRASLRLAQIIEAGLEPRRVAVIDREVVSTSRWAGWFWALIIAVATLEAIEGTATVFGAFLAGLLQ